MKRKFIVAVRGEEDRILVLEHPVGVTFPGGWIKEEGSIASLLAYIPRKVLTDTGLAISGLHLHGVSAKHETHRYSAYVTGGKLPTFPTAKTPDVEGYLSASWMAPALILQLTHLPDEMKELVTDLRWLNVTRAR